MQFLYVLYIDHFTDLADQEIRLASDKTTPVLAELPADVAVGLDWPYSYHEAIGNMVKSATPDTYDAIVIGNNLGMGTVYAELLSRSMWPRTLVVFNNEPTDAERAAYKRLGVTRLVKRSELRDSLAIF